MAAIAKFISYDGGIAFSERAMKIQRCEEDPVIIPLDEVASVRVRRPQEDSDGFIRVDMADGIRYRLFFDTDQLQDALQFKEQFDNTVSGYREDDYTLYPHHETPVARRPARQNTQPYRDYPKRAPRTKRGFVPVAVAMVAIVAIVVIVIIVAILTRGEKSNDPKIPPDLTGYWVQTGGNSDESYQMATISGNTIEVYWYFEADQTMALYWAGTFDAPTVADEPYTWVSVNDKEKTNTSLFSSSDDTKNFTYKDGIVSYSASMLGVTSTIQLQKTDDILEEYNSGDQLATGVNAGEGVDAITQLDNVRKQIDVKAIPTQEGPMCVFITNNSAVVVDELDVQINYKDVNGNTIDVDSDGHDMILPGYTVVSRLDAPDEYADYQVEYDIEVGVHPNYENHSEQCDVSANQGDNCVIVQITNNSDVEIEEIEYVVVFYQGDRIAYVSYENDVRDVKPGDTITEKETAYSIEYNRFEVYLNQAQTFGVF